MNAIVGASLLTVVAMLPAAGLTATAKSKYAVVEVKNGGGVEGVVTLKGAAPKTRQVKIEKDGTTCGTGTRTLGAVSVAKENGGIRNAVVYLEKVSAGKDWVKPAGGYTLDQQNCRFNPGILVVPRGRKLTIKNSDPVLHNVHAYELIGNGRRGLFNLAQPIQGSKTAKKIRPRKSNLVKVQCDVHNFMEAWMFVADNPYYALADKEGRFIIKNIPPGKYRLMVWHPALGVKSSEVSVSAGETTEMNMQFKGRTKRAKAKTST